MELRSSICFTFQDERFLGFTLVTYMLCNSAYSQNDVKFTLVVAFAKFATFGKFAKNSLAILGGTWGTLECSTIVTSTIQIDLVRLYFGSCSTNRTKHYLNIIWAMIYVQMMFYSTQFLGLIC